MADDPSATAPASMAAAAGAGRGAPSAIPMDRVKEDVPEPPHKRSPVCNICHQLMTDPCRPPCGHFACLGCANTNAAPTCPVDGCGKPLDSAKLDTDGDSVQLIRSIINSIVVACEHHTDLGCSWESEVSRLHTAEHLRMCMGSHAKCDKCGEDVGVRHNLAAHLASNCSEGPRICTTCDAPVLRKLWVSHRSSEDHAHAAFDLIERQERALAAAATDRARLTDIVAALQPVVARVPRLEEELAALRARHRCMTEPDAAIARFNAIASMPGTLPADVHHELVALLQCWLRHLPAARAGWEAMSSTAAASPQNASLWATRRVKLLFLDTLSVLPTHDFQADVYLVHRDLLKTGTALLQQVPDWLASGGFEEIKPVWAMMMKYLWAKLPSVNTDAVLAFWEQATGHNRAQCEQLQNAGSYSSAFAKGIHYVKTNKTRLLQALRAVDRHCSTLRAGGAAVYNQFNFPYLVAAEAAHKEDADVKEAVFSVLAHAATVADHTAMGSAVLDVTDELLNRADALERFPAAVNHALDMLLSIHRFKGIGTFARFTIMPWFSKPDAALPPETFERCCKLLVAVADADPTIAKTLSDASVAGDYGPRVFDRVLRGAVAGPLAVAPVRLVAYMLTDPASDDGSEAAEARKFTRRRLRSAHAVQHALDVMTADHMSCDAVLHLLSALVADEDGVKEVAADAVLRKLCAKVSASSVKDAPLATVLLPVAVMPGGSDLVKAAFDEAKVKSWADACPDAAAEKKQWEALKAKLFTDADPSA